MLSLGFRKRKLKGRNLSGPLKAGDSGLITASAWEVISSGMMGLKTWG